MRTVIVTIDYEAGFLDLTFKGGTTCKMTLRTHVPLLIRQNDIEHENDTLAKP